jgi:hypothetical protein
MSIAMLDMSSSDLSEFGLLTGGVEMASASASGVKTTKLTLGSFCFTVSSSKLDATAGSMRQSFVVAASMQCARGFPERL